MLTAMSLPGSPIPILGQPKIDMTDVQRVSLKPGDVVILRLPPGLPPEILQQAGEMLRVLFPNNHSAVLDKNAELTVVTPDPEDEAA